MSCAYKMTDPEGCLAHQLHSDDYRKEGAGSIVYDFYNKSGMYINHIVIPTDKRAAAKKPNFYKNDIRYEVRY